MPETGASTASTVALLASGVALGGLFVTLLTSQKLGGRSGDTEPRSTRQFRRSKRRVFESDSDSENDSRESHRRQTFTTVRRKQIATTRAMGSESDDDGLLAVRAGFSMEEAREMADQHSAKAKNKTPQEVLGELQRGNARFWTGRATRPEKSAFERRALISKQFPSVAILGCSDSRVPVEIVFDQGLGDVFVIRVAGNCLDTTTTASLQYAVHHLQVKVLIVLGHEGCGAVKASQLPAAAISKEPAELGSFLNTMKKQLAASELGKVHDQKAADREAVTANVKNQVDLLTQDASIMSKVQSGEVMMCGAFYEISSGIVDFFHEVSLEGKAPGDHPSVTPLEYASKPETRGVRVET